MAYVADLHIHSRYAQACSGQLSIPNLAKWAKYKGIHLLGTGDFLHPEWQKEIRSSLTELGNGLYEHAGVKFLLTTEVACIYTEGGRSRRIHVLVFLPSLDAVDKFTQKLVSMGINYAYDGRPILGMSCKKLCEIVFAVEPTAIIIPAHAWTPWFGIFGSNSGYDSFTECFGDFSDQILAIETGLSSEPAMNWRIGQLDKKSIVSFSDLHSLPRLGREVTLIGGSLSYEGLRGALANETIVGTIEFFPEEGKYHYSGHRNCGIVYDEKELKQKGKICPVCHKPLTVGVMQRIDELATRSEEELGLYKENEITKSKLFPKRPGFRMLVQLEEIIAEALGTTPRTVKVQDMYEQLVLQVDSELMILTKTPIELLSMVAGEKIADGVDRVRRGELVIEPGYDNTYGKVKIWPD